MTELAKPKSTGNFHRRNGPPHSFLYKRTEWVMLANWTDAMTTAVLVTRGPLPRQNTCLAWQNNVLNNENHPRFDEVIDRYIRRGLQSARSKKQEYWKTGRKAELSRFSEVSEPLLLALVRADMPSILLRYLDLVYGRDPSLVLAVLRDTLNCTVGFVGCFSEFPWPCLASWLVNSPFANFGNCEFQFNFSTFLENCLIVNWFISWIDSWWWIGKL